MSTPHIETEGERATREAATIAIGTNAHGAAVHAVCMIDPNGHLVQVPTGTKLKGGWRYATPSEVAEHKADARSKENRAENATPAE